jgi:SAM-dependent methyltransferase
MTDARREEFGARLLEMLTGSVLTMLIGLGQRTGLFDAAAQGPGTSEELARRAGLDERYVREWLGAMVTGAVFEYDAGRYIFPAGHAVLLTGQRASNIGPAVGTLGTLSAVLPAVERCFTEGGGVPYAAYAEAAGDTLGESWRYIYDEQLIDGFLGPVPGLAGRLEAGARVLDIGCGSGHAVNLMAQAYPRSEFVGLDIAAGAIARGEAERAALALDNASFVVADAAALPPGPPFDVITAFDAIHDQRSPQAVLAGAHDALVADGIFVMVDAKFSSLVQENVGNPHAALCYGISLLYCLPTSLAEGGAGLGAMWGRQTALGLLADAGFREVRVLDSPRPQNCIYLCRRSPAPG